MHDADKQRPIEREGKLMAGRCGTQNADKWACRMQARVSGASPAGRTQGASHWRQGKSQARCVREFAGRTQAGGRGQAGRTHTGGRAWTSRQDARRREGVDKPAGRTQGASLLWTGIGCVGTFSAYLHAGAA